MLEYILVQESLGRYVDIYIIRTECLFSSTSNYLPIVCCLKVSENLHIDIKAYLALPAWQKIETDTIKTYQTTLSEPLDKLLTGFETNCNDINLLYITLVDIPLNTAKSVIPSSTFNRYTKPYWNSKVKESHKNEREKRRRETSEEYIKQTFDDINSAYE